MGFSEIEETPPQAAANVDAAPEFKSSRGGDHLLALRAPELDAGADDWDAVQEADPETGEFPEDMPPEPEQLSRDAFFEVFRMGFDMPGVFSETFKPLGIQEGEEGPCRAASDAVYRLLEIYYPRALMPAGETVALLAAAAPFFIAKAIAFRQILADMRAAKIEAAKAARRGPEPPQGQAVESAPPAPQEPANDPAPPKGGAFNWMDAEAA